MTTRGYALPIALVFLGIFATSAAALLGYLTTYARAERVYVAASQARMLAEAGIDHAIYELNQGGTYTGETDTPLGTGTFSVAVSDVGGSMKELEATGYVPNRANPLAVKTVRVRATIDTTTVSFHYGVQVGDGGVTFGNNSSIEGNLYSNGAVTGANGTVITGDTVAAGASAISRMTIGGSARARTLSNCSVAGNATYQTISNCPVQGTKTATTTLAATTSMPISDEQITVWKEAAENGGVISGNYTINDSQQLGPRKINGDLTVNGTLTLSGPLWVNGNATFGNNATLAVAGSAGGNGAVLVADYPTDPARGDVTFANNVIIQGNGTAGSYPMVLSTSIDQAISLANNARGVILYAPYGRITLANNASANQITAYALTLSNNAEVEYESGLISASFVNGPGGSWTVARGTYEIQ